ncbi:hypothetical protein OUZ56_011832 [Daphnia magna]|uniref:Uncharacterized protein n=1 Tax=Daphnia magna TaxID=35525 RepID=A0ABQ9Z1B0_9CRUS|nr:hypothetical protein OUZ56_011832 [Daphnia magna]
MDGRPWMKESATNRTTGPTTGRALMLNVYMHKKMVLGHRTELAGIGTEIDATGSSNGLRTLNTELEQGTTNILDFTPSISQELPAEERKEFEDTLRDNTDCFAKEGERLRRCNVAEHEIQLTPNATPNYQTKTDPKSHPQRTDTRHAEERRDRRCHRAMDREDQIDRKEGWKLEILP